MKSFRTVIATALALLLCLTTQAQWAGQDKTVQRKSDNSQQVTIGEPGSSSACYQWTGPNIIGDPNKAVITVNPQDERNEYRVRRIDKCGVEEDMVVVTVKDSIAIVSITPNRECYSNGDTVLLEHFTIVTDPPGYESLVKFLPDKAYISSDVNEDEQTFYFWLNHNGHESRKNVTVEVYNENEEVDTTTIKWSTIKPYFDAVKKVYNFFKNKTDTVKQTVKKVNALKDMIEKIKPKGLPMPDFYFDLDADLAMPTFVTTCCNGEEKWGFNLSGPALYVNAGLSFDFPIPGLSIGGAGGLFVSLKFDGKVVIGPCDIRYRGFSGCSRATIPIEVEACLSGGVKASILDGIVEAELHVQGCGDAKMLWKVGEDFKVNGVTFTAFIGGSVTAGWGAVEKHVTHKLGTITLMQEN